MPTMLPSFEFRRRAREAMKPVMSVLIVVMLIAMLPSLITRTIAQITESDPAMALADLYTQERVTALMSADAAVSDAAIQEFKDGMIGFLQQKWPFLALSAAISLLIAPVLKLGLNHTLLKTLRREEITTGTVLARLPLFFKAIGLEVMVALRIFLWMLPGMAGAMVGGVLMVFVPLLGMLVMVVSMGLYVVLMTRAMYSYRLAFYVMADTPQTGVMAAIRRSRDVMQGRRMELFFLELSFAGWYLLMSFGQTMLLGMLGNVLGMALGMFLSFFLQMYIYMAEAAFYQEYAVGPITPPEAEESPEEDALN